MAITAIQQIRDFELSVITGSGTELYQVLFDDAQDSPGYDDYEAKFNLIKSAGIDPVSGLQIPKKGQRVFGDTSSGTSFVTDVRPFIFEGQNNFWKVTVTYSISTTNEEEEEVFDKDPWDIDPVYSWTSNKSKVKIWEDRNTIQPIPILSSAGGAFTTLVQVDDSDLMLTVTRFSDPNGATPYDPIVAMGFYNTINDDFWAPQDPSYQFLPNQAKLITWDGTLKIAEVTNVGLPPEEKEYWKEKFVFQFKKGTWIERVLDQDLYEFVTGGASAEEDGRHRIRINGQLVTTPQPINGGGRRLFDDDGTIANAADIHVADPAVGIPETEEIFTNDNLGNAITRGVFLLFQPYPEADFSVLDL